MNFLPLALRFAPLAIAGALAVTAYQTAPIVGVNAQRHHLEHQRDQWKKVARGWEENTRLSQLAFHKSEALRAEETASARQAIEAETASCNLRVAEARKSALAIKRIVERPVKVDANQCPVRETVSADDLKAALGAR